MMRLRNAVLLLTASILAISSITGCSTNNNNNSGQATNGKASNSEATITVDFWTAPQQILYNFWEKKIGEFNASNTKVNGKTVQVAVQQMPESPSSEAGIQNAIATGTVPAISENISRGFASTLASSDVIYDLQEEEWFRDIVEARAMDSAIKGWEINGKQYVIPVYLNPMIWQWNMKALKELGVTEAPKTVDQLKAVIQAFVENKDKMKAIGVTHTFYRPSLTRADQWWDRWFDFQMPYEALSGGKPWVEGDELLLDEEAAIKTFELIGLFGNTIQQGEMSNIWVEPEPSILVAISAPWEIDLLRENNKVYGEDFIYGPSIVEKEGDVPYNFADSKGFVLYKHSSISEEEHAGAIEFVKWVYNTENSAQTDLEWLNATNMLPVRGDLNDNTTFSNKMKEYPELEELAEAVPYSIPGMAHEKEMEIQMALTESGYVPYMAKVFRSDPLNAPDATDDVKAAIEAMKQAGGLE